MRIIDHPISFVRGRTPRELTLLGIGAGYSVYELLLPEPMWSNVVLYALATVLFAVRFFPARALGVGIALGALAQRLPDLRISTFQLTEVHTWTAALVIVLLWSRDLEAKFERAPSRISWLPNAWAALPERDMRLLRACTYAIGTLAAVLVSLWAPAFWGYATDFEIARAWFVVGFLTLTIVLLAAGRAPALFLIPMACIPVAVGMALELERAEEELVLGQTWWLTAQFVLPALVLSIVATLLALPYCVRLLRRAA